MFKHAAIKRYGKRLLPKLQKRYGTQLHYSASQVRATVYQCSFKPKYLPLGYILFLDEPTLKTTIAAEFPDLCINSYKEEMRSYLDERKYHGNLTVLSRDESANDPINQLAG